jgi:hypothetical protein
MFGLPPRKMPIPFNTILFHVNALRLQLDKLERQVREGDLGNWPETVSGIRESAVLISEDTEEIWADEQWAERKAEEAYYGKEVVEEMRRKREERKRGAAM